MNNILLVFTGGTIGSSIDSHVINTQASNRYKLIELYRQKYDRATRINFQMIAPVEILSENLHPSIWETIIAAIDAFDKTALDGIIVTHGTDTLAYSAAALALFYTRIKLPIVLVSSNYPLSDPRANGLDNFNAALEFILQRREAGVFVAYCNPGHAPQIHFGSRLSSCLSLSNDFISVQSKTYLEFDDNEFRTLNPITPGTSEVLQFLPLSARYSTRILMIKAYPGLDYSHLNLNGIVAILHDLYHSGTACVSEAYGESHSLLSFIRACKHQDIQVYLAPARSSPDAYASTQALLECGAKIIWDTSLEAAYVKLLMAYGNFDDPQLRDRFLAQNIAHEQLDANTN